MIYRQLFCKILSSCKTEHCNMQLLCFCFCATYMHCSTFAAWRYFLSIYSSTSKMDPCFYAWISRAIFFFLASKKNRPKYQYVKKNFLKEKYIYIFFFSSIWWRRILKRKKKKYFQLNKMKKNLKKKEKNYFQVNTV